MAEQNTSNIDTVVTSKPALVTDLNSSFISKEQYSHARNAVRNSKDGDLGTIGNEPSLIKCYSAPYKIVGIISLPDNTDLVFSTDNTNSEIGVGDPKTCSYKKLLNLKCLNFNTNNSPITGEAKKDFNKSIVVTFTDKSNPIRRIDLSTIATIKSCDDILLFKKIDQPCLDISVGQVGNIPNGVYSVVIAYSVDGKVFSDWYSITNRIFLNSPNNSNSINVNISNLDKEFDEFVVALVGNYIDPATKGATKLNKIVGRYSTKVKSISITDFINSQYEEIKTSDLIIKKTTWQTAGIITSNSNILIIADLVARKEEDYQLKAMTIESEYIVEQVPLEYYEENGLDIGYYRDENYDFYIQGVYNTGEMTDKYHIPGPKPTAEDLSAVSSADVYEFDNQFKDCENVKKVEKYKVYNNAGKLQQVNEQFKCNRRIIGKGKMGSYLSTELYPDNIDTFGKDANTPIRYHKTPDESKIPRYSKIDGKTYINIIGVRFKKIPAFNSPDIVGYKITRSDRKGGNGTVIARGIMSNVRYYDENEQRIMYTNYTLNDLGPDQYLSEKQTYFKNNKENDFKPLTGYYKDRFNFYSPHTMFEPKYTLGSEIKIETEEVAEIKGKFDLVYNHPGQKLMNQFSFWLAAAVGFIEAALVIIGKNTSVAVKSSVKTNLTGTGLMAGTLFNTPGTDLISNQINSISDEFKFNSVEDLVSLDVIGFIKAKILAKDLTSIQIIKNVLNLLTSLAIKIPFSLMKGIKEADEVFDIIYNFTGYTDYVYQYNSKASFVKSIPIKEGNKRRRLLRNAVYLPSDIVSIDGDIFNNYFREKSVYLHLNKEIKDPSTKDVSRKTIGNFGSCDDPIQEVKSTGSMFYATSKIQNPNQYGALGSSAPVSVHSCVLTGDETPVLYGGDCIIGRMSFLKKMQFFNQNIANTNYPNGTEYDYKLYRNIAYPRYWMDTTKFNFSEVISGAKSLGYGAFQRTTQSRYNLDCKKKKDGKSISRIDDAYMYLSNNCAVEYIVECDYNINYREETKDQFYSKNNNNVQLLFRSDKINNQEEFNINRVYSDLYTTEIYAQQQRSDFDPKNPIPVSQPNSIIYSLSSFNLQKVDNWQYFLPANYFAFSEADFGNLTAVHKIDQDRLIFLFSKASPFISMGRSLLKLSNQTVTIGDGGLFAQDPRELMPTDNNYAACNSRYAFSNTHMGRFYPSENQGRIISYTEGLDDITRQGMSFWCKNYMPIFLYKHFPTYVEQENPISGVGYLTAFDSFNETVYITKRDFSPKYKDITYNGKDFTYNGNVISLRDKNYFNDISWTLSYSPLDKSFVSWHDWHPDWIIQKDNHFMSVKDNTVWKHNEAYDSFCNFYGVDYPFEIEVLSNSGQQVETVRSLEYILEVYKYKNFGRDKFHILNQNFSNLLVWNTEQISPLLNMSLGNPDPEQNLKYPKLNTSNNVSYDIVFFKEENKYRVNQFWDTTKDRGEFNNSEFHLFPTDESGYKNVVNNVAINLNKPEEQRKKFRHYFNKFRFIKSVSGENKFLFKILNIKKEVSVR